MNKRIVITGMGAVTPVGIGVDAYWQGLLAKKCGIGPITKIDTSHLPVKNAAEVKGFVAKDHLSPKLVADLDPFMQYAFVAAKEAIAMSGVDFDPLRSGVVMGTALGGLETTERTAAGWFLEEKNVGPRFLTKIMGNIAASQLAIEYGIKGPSMTVSTACSSGGDAISLAAMILETGAADTVVVMAGEAATSALFILSLYKAGALSKSGDSRPFDQNRDGFVIGEGGGALVLETLEHAKKRGAEIKAELLGYGNNTDAFHPVAPDPEGRGGARCMRVALDKAGLSPTAIDYINAHGTATVKGDLAEADAINSIFGRSDVAVSSTKGATGHLMGAGGITEVIACVKALETGLLPPTLHCDERDKNCDVHIITDVTEKQISVAMSNALGFGGQNSSIILGKPNS